MSKFIFRVALLCSLVAASQAQVPPTQTCASTSAPPSRYQHVVIFSFENRTWSNVGGVGFLDPAMPYLHSIATSCSYFSDWTETNTSQNSLTQYIGETSGVNNSSTVNDCSPSTTCRSTDNNIFRQVRLAGGTARNYVEGATSGCSASGNAAKHIPALYYYGTYTDSSGVTHNDHDYCLTEVRPYSEFDVNNMPTYAFITPSLCNDGHDCGNSTVDGWASTNIQRVLNSTDYLSGNTAVFIWYDEDHPVPNTQIAPTAHAGDITQTGIGTHAALLKTIELMLGLPVMQQGQLTTAADLRAITGLASTGGSTISVSISISPTSTTVASGGTQQFKATVTGSTNTAVTWSTSAGTISSTGLFTAPTATTTTTVTVKATSQADTTKSASATVTITPPSTSVAVTISPTSATVASGGTQQFTVTVTGTTTTAVTWSASFGTVSSGFYTAPTVSVNTTATVKATSVADPTKSASATVSITAPPTAVAISISPTSATVASGGTKQFTATVSGTTNTAVTWSASAGSISSGLYTAPTVTANSTATVTVTSAADPTKSASATVSITAPPTSVAISISPTSATVASSGTQQFTATVTGTANMAVNWSASAGSVSSSGLYTAPAVTSNSTAVVTATSAADPTKSASATVSITPPPTAVAVSISPTSATVASGGTQQFTATVTGTTNTTVNWSASEGSISSSGLYTAPPVTANSTAMVTAGLASPTKSASTVNSSATAVVTIMAPGLVSPVVTNPGFELGSTGWAALLKGGATISIVGDSANAHSGTNYAEVSSGSDQHPYYFSADSTGRAKYFPVTPGQVVTFGGWVYRVSGDGTASWRIQGFSASKSIVAHAFPVPSNVTTVGVWTLEQGTYTVPTGVAYVRFLLDVYRSTVPTVVRFDDGFLAIK